MKKAIIAMSGGVDSSVAAYFMKQKGFECIGATMKLYDNEDIGVSREKTCCSLDDIEDARAVARKLDMPYYVFNFKDEFEQKVIDKFIKTYEQGGTPNPCIDCNRYLKFEKLMHRMRELKYDYVVTGHYADIELVNGRYLLKKGADESKDQSYVLYSLTQEQLAHTLFPLGKCSKAEIREI
ncbi:MAG: tRNA 2-thiouridine(34) synthase MnmA, partial [Eubacterium sp.]|nr:tRNA 2-thiouridine(34) synthase MnmA [Eubacterium sp.]